jgi:hypothetical protein
LQKNDVEMSTTQFTPHEYYPFLDVEKHVFDPSRYPDYAAKFETLHFVEPHHPELLERVLQGRKCDDDLVRAYRSRVNDCPDRHVTFNVLVPENAKTGMGRWRQSSLLDSVYPGKNSNVCLASLKKTYRASVLEGYDYVDCDASSCHPSILNFFIKHSHAYSEEERRTFNHFLEHKKEIRQEVLAELRDDSADPATTRPLTGDHVKTLFTALCYGGNPYSLVEGLRKGESVERVFDEETQSMVHRTVQGKPFAIKAFGEAAFRRLPDWLCNMQNLIDKAFTKVMNANWPSRHLFFDEEKEKQKKIAKWRKEDPVARKDKAPSAAELEKKLRKTFAAHILRSIEHFTVAKIFLDELPAAGFYDPHTLIWQWDGVSVRLNSGHEDVHAFVAEVNRRAQGSALTFEIKPFEDADTELVNELRAGPLAQFPSPEELPALCTAAVENNRALASRKRKQHYPDTALGRAQEALAADFPAVDSKDVAAIQRNHRNYEVCAAHFNEFVKKVSHEYYIFHYTGEKDCPPVHTLLGTFSREKLLAKFENYYYYEASMTDGGGESKKKKKRGDSADEPSPSSEPEVVIKKNKFLTTWLQDEETRDFNVADRFPPQLASTLHNGQRVLNIWKDPLYYSWHPTPDQLDLQKLDTARSAFEDIIRLLTNNNQAHQEWLRNYTAWLVQKPHLKPLVYPVLCGKKGVGKSSYCVMLRKAFGEAYVHSETNPQSNILGNHNGILSKGAQVFIFDDCNQHSFGRVDPKTGVRDDAAMKSMLTNETITINDKHIAQFTVRNCFQWIFCLNAGNAYPDDRRYMGFSASDERLGDSQYWQDVYSVIEQPWFGRYVYHYLRSVAIESWNPRAFLANDFHTSMKCSGVDKEISFLIWLQDLIDVAEKQRVRYLEVRPSNIAELQYQAISTSIEEGASTTPEATNRRVVRIPLRFKANPSPDNKNAANRFVFAGEELSILLGLFFSETKINMISGGGSTLFQYMAVHDSGVMAIESKPISVGGTTKRGFCFYKDALEKLCRAYSSKQVLELGDEEVEDYSELSGPVMFRETLSTTGNLITANNQRVEDLFGTSS